MKPLSLLVPVWVMVVGTAPATGVTDAGHSGAAVVGGCATGTRYTELLNALPDDDIAEDVEDTPTPAPAAPRPELPPAPTEITIPEQPPVSADVPEEASATAPTENAAQPTMSTASAEPTEQTVTSTAPKLPADRAGVLAEATSPVPVPEIEDTSGLPPVLPTVHRLGKRTPDGDWVTAQFDRPVVPREQTRVAVLGYHNFSNTKPVSDMLLRTADFCRQMQYIHDAGLSVISMQDFLEWRFGTRLLPERCVLITIDDGWKSVYTDAFPVLKAYGYPFTLFLYTRYIGVKGASMTPDEIREMMAWGATIGSHSSNHLYPSKWKRYAQGSPAYAAQTRHEIADSRTKLCDMFGNCSTYCYPGGYNTPPMLEELPAAGYAAAFTVLESKVSIDEPAYLVHRYMVFGTDHEIFRRAVNFDDVAGIIPTRRGIAEAEAHARAFFPKAFEGLTTASAAPTATVSPADAKIPEAPAAVQSPPALHTGPTPAAEPAPVSVPHPMQAAHLPTTTGIDAF